MPIKLNSTKDAIKKAAKSANNKLNKSVQDRGLFGSLKDIFIEDNLVGKSRQQALNNMNKQTQSKLDDVAKYMAGEGKDIPGLEKSRRMVENSIDLQTNKFMSDTEKAMSSAPWGADPQTVIDTANDVMRNAKANLYADNYANFVTGSNASLSFKDYEKAVRASKRDVKRDAMKNTVTNYFVEPFKDGRVGAGVARAGAGVATVGSGAAVVSKLNDD